MHVECKEAMLLRSVKPKCDIRRKKNDVEANQLVLSKDDLEKNLNLTIKPKS